MKKGQEEGGKEREREREREIHEGRKVGKQNQTKQNKEDRKATMKQIDRKRVSEGGRERKER